MSKVKISLSLVLSFLMVSFFAITASAAPLTAVKDVYPTYDSGTGTVTITFTQVTGATGYDVKLQQHVIGEADHSADPAFVTAAATVNTNTPAQWSAKFVGVDFNDYNLEVTITATNGNVAEDSTKVVTYNALPTTLTGTNVHKTGTDVAGKFTRNHTVSDTDSTSQQTHGNYQNNTSSCASCHQTHTGSDSNFLFKKGDICETCHDGSLGVYDVTDAAMAGNAGYFAGDDSTAGKAEHSINGNSQIKDAPGGLGSSGVTMANANWGGEFGCESCHNPHGSQSGKLLTVDPNGWAGVEHAATGDAINGKKYSNISIVNVADVTTGLPAEKVTATADMILVKTTFDSAKAPFNTAIFTGADASVKPADGQEIILTYRWDDVALKYVVDYSMWKRTYSKGSFAKMFYTAYTSSTVNTEYKIDGTNPDLKINFSKGYMFLTTGTFPAFARADMAFGIAIDFSVIVSKDGGYRQEDTVNGAFFNSSIKVDGAAAYNMNSGYSMSKFCAGCHVDYYSQGHAKITGQYTQAFRHTTNGDSYTCVLCHFAHGTAPEIMKDAKENTFAELTASFAGDTAKATAYLKDETGAPALKRYTGMAVCFSCHDKAIVASGSDSKTASNLDMNNPGSGTNGGHDLNNITSPVGGALERLISR